MRFLHFLKTKAPKNENHPKNKIINQVHKISNCAKTECFICKMFQYAVFRGLGGSWGLIWVSGFGRILGVDLGSGVWEAPGG